MPATSSVRHHAGGTLTAVVTVVMVLGLAMGTFVLAWLDVGLAWLATIVIGALIYFLPLAQFLGRFAE